MKNKTIATFISICILLFTSCRIQMVSVSKIENIKLVQLNQKGLEIEMSVKIKNPNKFGFNIYRSGLTGYYNGVEIGELKTDRKIKIKRKSDDVHTFKLTSDFSKMSLTDIPKLLALGNKRSDGFNVKGQIKVGKFLFYKKFDVDHTERVNINKYN